MHNVDIFCKKKRNNAFFFLKSTKEFCLVLMIIKEVSLQVTILGANPKSVAFGVKPANVFSAFFLEFWRGKFYSLKSSYLSGQQSFRRAKYLAKLHAGDTAVPSAS